MIRVVVNHNSDEVQIGILEGKREEIISLPCKNTSQTVSILTELLNALDHSGTALEEVNEDSSKTIGEW